MSSGSGKLNGKPRKKRNEKPLSDGQSVNPALNHLPLFCDDSEGYWDSLSSILDEKTVELKCTCGIWTVYGKTYPYKKHPDYCDLVRKDK